MRFLATPGFCSLGFLDVSVSAALSSSSFVFVSSVPRIFSVIFCWIAGASSSWLMNVSEREGFY